MQGVPRRGRRASGRGADLSHRDGLGEGGMMLTHVRQTVRSLVKAPGYTLAFVLTLGLGIGLNTAIFSVINGVLLAPLPYPDADRIVYIRQPALGSGVENARFS